MTDIIMTTTPSVEGKTIAEYLVVVAGFGLGFSSTPDFVSSVEKCADLADAFDTMRNEATAIGADAVVGVQVTASGAGAGYGSATLKPRTAFAREWLIYVIGTAVKLK